MGEIGCVRESLTGGGGRKSSNKATYIPKRFESSRINQAARSGTKLPGDEHEIKNSQAITGRDVALKEYL